MSERLGPLELILDAYSKKWLLIKECSTFPNLCNEQYHLRLYFDKPVDY